MLKYFKTINTLIALLVSVSVFAQPGLINSLTVKQLAAGSNHSLVLLSDGSLWAWGQNAGGQLGDSSTTNSDKAIRVGKESSWAAITAGSGFTHGIKTDGTLWGWGINKVGQLGVPTTNLKYMYTAPVQIGKDKDWQMVSSGKSFTVGLKTDGTIWVWGTNIYYLLPGKTNQYEPLKIADKNNKHFKQIATGDEFFMAIKNDGSLWTMGKINDKNKSLVKLNDDTDWVSMDAGRLHAMALKKDGSLWGWGDNSQGQLGNGTKEDSKVPIKVAGEFKAVTATDNYTAAVKENSGEVYWWGQSWPVKLGISALAFTGKTSFYPFIAALPNGNIITVIDNVLVWEFSINENYGGSMKTLK